MAPKTRVFRFGRDQPGKPKDTPASLGCWIRDTGESPFVAISDARRLLCWINSEEMIFVYDFAAGRLLSRVFLPSFSEDAQHVISISDLCLTHDYVLVAWEGLYYMFAISDLVSLEEDSSAEDFVPVEGGEKAIAVEGAGEGYKNTILTPAPSGEGGVDLVSIHPYEVRRTYRLPPEQTEMHQYQLEWFDFNRNLVIASFSSQESTDKWILRSTTQWIWDFETGQVKGPVNLSAPFYQGEWGRPFLDERYMHFWSTLIELPSFRSIHTFGARHSLLTPLDIVGIAGDKIVTAELDSSEDEIFVIYSLPGFHKEQEIKIEGYRWIRELHSHRYFLLAKNQGEQDFILVDLVDFCEKDYQELR